MSIRKDFHEQSLATRHQFPILLATPVVCESFSRAHFGAAEAFRLAKYGLFPPRIELGARIRRIRRVTTVPRELNITTVRMGWTKLFFSIFIFMPDLECY